MHTIFAPLSEVDQSSIRAIARPWRLHQCCPGRQGTLGCCDLRTAQILSPHSTFSTCRSTLVNLLPNNHSKAARATSLLTKSVPAPAEIQGASLRTLPAGPPPIMELNNMSLYTCTLSTLVHCLRLYTVYTVCGISGAHAAAVLVVRVFQCGLRC